MRRAVARSTPGNGNMTDAMRTGHNSKSSITEKQNPRWRAGGLRVPAMASRPSRRRGRLTEQQEAAAAELRALREGGGLRTEQHEARPRTAIGRCWIPASLRRSSRSALP